MNIPKLRTTALAAALMAGTVVSLPSSAEAQWRWRGGWGWGGVGVGLGLATGAIIGSALATRPFYNYYGSPYYGYGGYGYSPALYGYSYGYSPLYSYSPGFSTFGGGPFWGVRRAAFWGVRRGPFWGVRRWHRWSRW
jgi:hypothetical protein